MEELLRLWVSTPSLPRDQHVRSIPSHAAPETAQPTALPTAGGGQLLRTDPATWVEELVDAGDRATACACPRREAFRRAGCREIRLSGSTRGEWVAPQGVALSPTLPSLREKFWAPAFRAKLAKMQRGWQRRRWLSKHGLGMALRPSASVLQRNRSAW